MSCSPLFLSIFRRRRARRIPRRHSDVTSRTWWNGLFFSSRAYTRWEHFCFRFFFDLSGVQADFFPDYWNKTADFWESLRSFRSSQSTAESVFIWSLQNLLDRADRLDRTHLYSSDRGRLRRLGRLRSSWHAVFPIWSSRSFEHYSRRLGRSGRSYAWKTGFSKLFAVASSFHSL